MTVLPLDGCVCASRIEPAAYRALMQVGSAPTLLVELETGLIIEVNRSARRRFGYTAEQLSQFTLSDLLDPKYKPDLTESVVELCSAGVSTIERTVILDSQGRSGWFSMSLAVERVGSRPIVLVTLRDLETQIRNEEAMDRTLAELRKAQSQLARSEAHYRAILHSAADAILISDFDSAKFVEVNQSAAEMFGYSPEELQGMTGRDLHPPEANSEVDKISQQLNESGSGMHESLTMVRKDGSVFHASLRMSQLAGGHVGDRAYVTVIRDVSALIRQELELRSKNEELRSTQARLVQASKMAAMGSLSAGIAHELNQPLTVIGGFASRIKRKQEAQVSQVSGDLDIIVREVSRMASIVGNIRQFGRQEELKLQRTDAMRPLELAFQLMEAQCKDGGIRLERVLPDRPFEVMGDTGKLQQVFLNLLTNARDAVEPMPPEQRWIRVLVWSTDRYILYRVEDGGPGVPADEQAKLFDPFFTTKGPDRGMGLGLSIAFSLVSSHRGMLRYVESEGSGYFEVAIPKYESSREVGCDGE